MNSKYVAKLVGGYHETKAQAYIRNEVISLQVEFVSLSISVLCTVQCHSQLHPCVGHSCPLYHHHKLPKELLVVLGHEAALYSQAAVGKALAHLVFDVLVPDAGRTLLHESLQPFQPVRH